MQGTADSASSLHAPGRISDEALDAAMRAVLGTHNVASSVTQPAPVDISNNANRRQVTSVAHDLQQAYAKGPVAKRTGANSTKAQRPAALADHVHVCNMCKCVLPSQTVSFRLCKAQDTKPELLMSVAGFRQS